MESTVVELVVKSTKQNKRWNPEAKDWSFAPEHEIEFEIPYVADSIFYQQSGGTTLTLKTINQEAAALFKTGTVTQMLLTPKE